MGTKEHRRHLKVPQMGGGRIACLIVITLLYASLVQQSMRPPGQAHFEKLCVPNYTLSLQFSDPEIDRMRSNKNVVFYLGEKSEMMSSLAPVHWRHFSTLFPQSARTLSFPSWPARWISDSTLAQWNWTSSKHFLQLQVRTQLKKGGI